MITPTKDLLPCLFCRSGLTNIVENGKQWLGSRYGEPSSVSVWHHCEPIRGQPSRSIERVGRDRKAAIEAWNMRTSAISAPITALPEPEFYTAFAWQNGFVALPGYSNETENGVKDLILEAARKEGYKGTVAGRMFDLGWVIRPVYAQPIPSPVAQAAPLSEAQIDKHLDAVLRASGSALRHYTMQKTLDDMRAAMSLAMQGGAA